MSQSLHERLVGLVTQIYSQEKEAFRFDAQQGKAWQGVPPLFYAPIALRRVLYEAGPQTASPALLMAELEYDDTILCVGTAAAAVLTDSDPTGRYVFEGMTEVYTRHDHEICLNAFAKLRPPTTPLYTGYQEKQAHMIATNPGSIHDTSH